MENELLQYNILMVGLVVLFLVASTAVISCCVGYSIGRRKTLSRDPENLQMEEETPIDEPEAVSFHEQAASTYTGSHYNETGYYSEIKVAQWDGSPTNMTETYTEVGPKRNELVPEQVDTTNVSRGSSRDRGSAAEVDTSSCEGGQIKLLYAQANKRANRSKEEESEATRKRKYCLAGLPTTPQTMEHRDAGSEIFELQTSGNDVVPEHLVSAINVSCFEDAGTSDADASNQDSKILIPNPIYISAT